MSASVELPLDHDGFLRRECPHCEKEFKWHHGPANEEAELHTDAGTYYCPHCGQPAGPDSWWTQAQLDLIEGATDGFVGRELNDMLDDAFKGLRRTKHIKVTSTGQVDEPEQPEPLVEPDDMSIVTSPCHAWEPMKVPEESVGPYYCLVCGEAFAV